MASWSRPAGAASTRRSASSSRATRTSSARCRTARRAIDVLSEDVAQETFIAAWRQLGGLREPGRLRPWLCGIARNLARKARKARRRDELVDDGEPIAERQSVRRRRAWRGRTARSRRARTRAGDVSRGAGPLLSREPVDSRGRRCARHRARRRSMQRLSRGRRYLADSMTELVERSLRGGPSAPRSRRGRARRDRRHRGRSPCRCQSARPQGPKGSTMLKIALAASAAVAAGTTALSDSLRTARTHSAPAAKSRPHARAAPRRRQARPRSRARARTDRGTARDRIRARSPSPTSASLPADCRGRVRLQRRAAPAQRAVAAVRRAAARAARPSCTEFITRVRLRSASRRSARSRSA